jgi:hypothetical protein
LGVRFPPGAPRKKLQAVLEGKTSWRVRWEENKFSV